MLAPVALLLSACADVDATVLLVWDAADWPVLMIRSALKQVLVCFAVGLAVAILPATRAAPVREVCPLNIAEQVTVTEVTDGASFDVADGRHVRVAAIQAPKLSVGRSNITDWPLANEARTALSDLVLGKAVDLAFDERSVDRHGHVVAHVFIGADRAWLQDRLVAAGFVRVETRPDTRACAKLLLARENEARKAKRGIWAAAFYAVRHVDQLQGEIGTFQIVEGSVLNVVTRRDRTFLNFGPDYRTDFTITVSRRDMKRLAKEGVDPATWSGKKIRVRGWISLLNGPEIELTHAEQVELQD